MEQVQQTLARLAQAIADCATKRVVWEAARSAGDPDVFMRAQAHRQAEAAVKEVTEEAVQAYARYLLSHPVTQGGDEGVHPLT